jgi:hypothetical protein
MSRSQEGFTKYTCHIREIGLILTDGVYSMADRNIIVSLLWTIDFIICHCLMHQENLCAKVHSEFVVVVWKCENMLSSVGHKECAQFKYF